MRSSIRRVLAMVVEERAEYTMTARAAASPWYPHRLTATGDPPRMSIPLRDGAAGLTA